MKNIIIVFIGLFFGMITSCQSSSSNNNLKSGKIINPTDLFNHYEVIRKLKQQKSMGCWAVALTVLYSWKTGDNSIAIKEVLKKYGDKYVLLYETNAGILPNDEKDLYGLVKLNVIQGSNPSIDSWYQILKRKGPISITVDTDTTFEGRRIHALIINGIQGDGSPNKTNIIYLDPGDGKEYTIPFSKFINLYEGSANWPLQIIHYP